MRSISEEKLKPYGFKDNNNLAISPIREEVKQKDRLSNHVEGVSIFEEKFQNDAINDQQSLEHSISGESL